MKNKNLIIIALAIVIVVGAVGAGIGIYMNRPETVMQTSVQSLFEDVFAREEFEVISSVLESGSLEMIMSLSGDGKEASLEYKEYFGLSDYETYIEKLKFSVDDINIEGSAYASDDYMYVSVPAFYGEPVGIVRGKSAEKFDSSAFEFDSDSEFALDEETSDALKVFLSIYDDSKDKEFRAEVETLMKKYSELFMDLIADHAKITKDSGSVKVHGEEVNARIIKIEIDAECVYNIASGLYDELKADKDIPKMIKKYGKLADKYIAGTSLEGDIQTELGEDEDADLVKILLEEYDDMLDDLGDEIDSMEDDVDDSEGKIVVEMATKKSSSTLLALDVTQKADGEKHNIVNIQLGKNGAKKTDKITVDIADGEMSIDFSVKQNDKEAYRAELVLEQDETDLIKIFAKIDKSGEKFSFGMDMSEGSYEITGKYNEEGKKHIFDFKDILYTDSEGIETSLIDSIFADAEGSQIDLKIIICESDKPKPIAKGKVKSAFELSEDDISGIKAEAEKLYAQLEEKFGIVPDEDLPMPDVDIWE